MGCAIALFSRASDYIRGALSLKLGIKVEEPKVEGLLFRQINDKIG